MRIVLASASPSRRAILRSAGVDPIIDPAEIDEDSLLEQCQGQQPEDIVAQLATAKAHAVASRHPGDVVIGGDSMLLLDGKLQGKPHTVERTIQRWLEQRGRAAHLITGHCIINGAAGGASTSYQHVETSVTKIRFAPASDSDIEAYARTEEPLQCAGAFTLEALGGWFIDAIDGDPSSVIGLSLPVVRRALYSFGLNVSDFWNIQILEE
ncbi:Maf-like protein [Corynebacterium pseudotuberculosis]|uniref:Nucleoside triphosphate pyrophosphatase n=1 Tax=Corynebacterium pseudotuberculosis 258 TaxID=1168865 RepID=A0AAU8PKE8_CORPS|nr:nucleoside triphosphate pyrophosphatase [Corynebacterium pseudotuberculosis]AER68567.1 Maf-like protein [Corynebacterium pseudotuberculosis 1/06-A]AEQ06044.1 septum formation inhibitor Maf [Corynebacterium pseudotuberculosis CIP 52.97]AFB71826.1 septum formation inhibitor Maf [Corynebacterium pseudotuberculosis 316]AFH90323.1 septum formation inhibitor Maf [Corynebacterium pseudotuberculosis 31]AFK16134.1 septum formation inhibitor Maf [Corynebacterium pseudotuberculosis 258]